MMAMTVGTCHDMDVSLDTRTRKIQQFMTNTADDPGSLLRYFKHLVTCISGPPLRMMAEEIVSAGCLSKLVKFLHNDQVKLQEYAVCLLTNIAASIDPHTQAVAEAGAVPAMVGLLSCENLYVRNTAARGLANMAVINYGRDLIFGHDLPTSLRPLLSLDEVSQGASLLLRNLCMDRKPPPRLSCLRPCLPMLTSLVLHTNDAVSDDACYGLASLLTIHGSCLSPSLDASFLNEFRNLYTKRPDRYAFQQLNDALQQATLTWPPPLQETFNGSTKGTEIRSSQSNSTPKSPQCTSIPSSAQCTSSSTAASRAQNRRRPRSASPTGVCTISTPKRARRSVCADVCISPGKPRTRAFAKRLINRTLNHSACRNTKKKVELFRAVEEGDMERVEQLIHQVGPSVTYSSRAYTLLHRAAQFNQPHIALFLLQFISPNIVNHDTHTPAHLAAMEGHTKVLDILLRDPHINPSKRDRNGTTYTYWLGGHLFSAVLKEDVGRVRSLLRVGADVDQEMRQTIEGGLQVTSVRHLARVSHLDSILKMFDDEKRTSEALKTDPCPATQNSMAFPSPLTDTFPLSTSKSPAKVRGPDVYRMDCAPRGYVCILSYGSFQDRPHLHLEGSHTDAHNLASAFTKMGYSGHAHFSLTADETRHQLAKVRDMKVLAQAGCAVFIISSHGEPRRHFLTSDRQTIEVQWVLDLFKDSQCHNLKNKPKLFIWDLCQGHLEEESGRGKNYDELCGRVDEPLRDVVCLDSSSGGFTWHAFSKGGTPFIGALCSTLAQHAPSKELTGLYREFLKEYADVAPDAVPQLTNLGFNKKFYF